MLDTSIFIEYLRASNKSRTILYKLADTPGLSLSSVTYYELLMGATNEQKKKDVNLLTQHLTILPFNDIVAEKASGIYHALKQENKLIEFRDIFIAATAIAYKTPLKTLNVKHFKRIKELILV